MWSLSQGSESFHEVSDIGTQDAIWRLKGARSMALARGRGLLFTPGVNTSPNAIRAWHVQGGKLSRAYDLEGLTAAPVMLVVSADERYLATSSETVNEGIVIWDLDSKEKRSLRQGVAPSRLAFSPDGRTIASLSPYGARNPPASGSPETSRSSRVSASIR